MKPTKKQKNTKKRSIQKNQHRGHEDQAYAVPIHYAGCNVSQLLSFSFFLLYLCRYVVSSFLLYYRKLIRHYRANLVTRVAPVINLKPLLSPAITLYHNDY